VKSRGGGETTSTRLEGGFALEGGFGRNETWINKRCLPRMVERKSGKNRKLSCGRGILHFEDQRGGGWDWSSRGKENPSLLNDEKRKIRVLRKRGKGHLSLGDLVCFRKEVLVWRERSSQRDPWFIYLSKRKSIGPVSLEGERPC